jgi:hypothetical protein
VKKEIKCKKRVCVLKNHEIVNLGALVVSIFLEQNKQSAFVNLFLVLDTSVSCKVFTVNVKIYLVF